MSKNLVIVESPAKAKTIEKYLGKDFHVLSSVGHIRKDTKVDVNNDFSVTYEIDEEHKKVVSELKKAAKSADIIWLATDEDREGESISWHLLEVLNLPKNTHRITFHEITEPALKEAIAHPRTVDMSMVSSQQARQTLDMLVGFDLSGVVRRKVPGAISAGRVQSPALRLIVEKEREIEDFQPKISYKVTGTFKKDGNEFQATLEQPKSTPLDTDEKAENLLKSLENSDFTVKNIEKTDGKRANPVPFTTAALQIEANSRLGFSSRTTMSAAQALYQAGLITYHRTDSLNLSKQAIGQIAHYIEDNFGKEYLHIRAFKTKSASAQEAHEAIRPTNVAKEVAGKTEYEKKLYNLIRTRTLATQMENAKVAKTTVTLVPEKNKKATFIAKGEIVIFDGFLKVYGKSKDLELPELNNGDIVNYIEIIAHQTFSKPPARYTEGSLVKKLEELGIGRPSTYASIMTAIQSRGYVKKGEDEGTPRKVIEYVLSDGGASEVNISERAQAAAEQQASPEILTSGTSAITKRILEEKSGATKGKLLPTPVGELVSDFLTANFDQIVDYGFTADVEDKLDLIAEDKLEKVKMLRDFYAPFSKLVEKSSASERFNGATELGTDPKTGEKIYAKIGRNGGFIQLGENEKESGKKPRFAPLPKGETVKTVTLEQAIKQLSLPELPRNLGKAKDGVEIIAAAGPFGPYLKAGKFNIQIKGYDPYKITLEVAEPLYEAKKASILADFGEIQVINGAYGPYVKGPGRRNFAKVPKETDPKNLTKAECEKLLEEKKSSPRRRPHSVSRKKSAAKKAKAKK
ncbi:type I DNA topoisomerase [Candidatus Saccharibacteria bacterium]|nr:type I DNA topoisomerase [Candidatus Saccharibacteria bacterium]